MVENRKKHRQNSHPIIHCLTSEGVSEVSERANEWAQRSARAKQAGQSKRMSERCKWMSERTSEWPNTQVPILGFFKAQCGGWVVVGDLSRFWHGTASVKMDRFISFGRVDRISIFEGHYACAVGMTLTGWDHGKEREKEGKKRRRRWRRRRLKKNNMNKYG